MLCFSIQKFFRFYRVFSCVIFRSKREVLIAKRSNKRLVTYSTFQYTVIQLYKYGELSETSLSFEIIV